MCSLNSNSFTFIHDHFRTWMNTLIHIYSFQMSYIHTHMRKGSCTFCFFTNAVVTLRKASPDARMRDRRGCARMPRSVCSSVTICLSSTNWRSSINPGTCMYVCMYVRMYVCMYVYMYVCMYVFVYECMHVCMYVCMYVCMQNARMYACTCRYTATICLCNTTWRSMINPGTCLYVCLCACLYVCMYVCIGVYMCACMLHVCMHVICMYVCMYACMYAECTHVCMYV